MCVWREGGGVGWGWGFAMGMLQIESYLGSDFGEPQMPCREFELHFMVICRKGKGPWPGAQLVVASLRAPKSGGFHSWSRPVCEATNPSFSLRCFSLFLSLKINFTKFKEKELGKECLLSLGTTSARTFSPSFSASCATFEQDMDVFSLRWACAGRERYGSRDSSLQVMIKSGGEG